MPEPGTLGDIGGKLPMASPSVVQQVTEPTGELPSDYRPYPPPLATYEDIVNSTKLFMDTLKKLHLAMGTKFMIPVIGGRELDLHRLFVEVTSRGGLRKILGEKRWKDVTAAFNFPSSATNASFILRKYYISLLQHYEQIYFFMARGWTPYSSDAFLNALKTPPQGSGKTMLLSTDNQPDQKQIKHGYSSEVCPGPQEDQTYQRQIGSPGLHQLTTPFASSAPSTGSPVAGVIDGKFESGYLVTVIIGSEKLKGVLYETPCDPVYPVVPLQQQFPSVTCKNGVNSAAAPAVMRRRRRKKSEIRRRDPAHPKPNRSGYNFFFAEQHARLKPLYPGMDREISRMIGESWNKLKEPEKAVYQETAARDKERYRIEMEDYKEKLRTGQIISYAVPLQQRPPEFDVSMEEQDEKMEIQGLGSHTPENGLSSGKSSKSDMGCFKASTRRGSPAENTCPGSIFDTGNAGTLEMITSDDTLVVKEDEECTGEEETRGLSVGLEKGLVTVEEMP